MNDVAPLLPIITLFGMMLLLVLGLIVLVKKHYKKVNPGEVIILNSLEANPKVIRSGAFVLPVVHSASSVSLKAYVINVGQQYCEKIYEQYGLNFERIVVQVKDEDVSILKAYQRISPDGDLLEQLNAILEQAIQEALQSPDGYEQFKKHLSTTLDRVGFELVT